jgi:AcrR family transcriptional regulator
VKSTKEKIVDLAEELIRTKGYNGFSYKDISSILSIKNAAIHYHFPTKEELGIAVIRRSRDGLKNHIEVSLSTSETSHNRLEEFIDIYRKSYQKHLICFMGALGSSFDHLPKGMQQELKLASKEIRDWVKSILEEGQKKGEFTFKGNATDRADTLIASLLASLVLSKVTGENVLEKAVSQIKLDL